MTSNDVLAERVLPAGQRLQIAKGDITAETTDAIVNAANKHLQHGAGVAGAILRRGGAIIQQESDEWIRTHVPVSHLHPAWTSGGRLPVKYVIHAVGPVWGEGDEDRKLTDCVTGALHLADELGVSSLAMPAISTGIFGFPRPRAAKIMLRSIQDYFSATVPSSIKQIRIILFDAANIEAFLNSWQS